MPEGGTDWWRPWAVEVANGHVRPPAVALMRAQPGFDDALLYSVRANLWADEHEPELRRMQPDTAASFLALTALYLDVNGGLTHRRLRDAAGMHGVLSGGRVSTLLMRMQMIGQIETVREDGPGRTKLYRPTAGMTATFRRRYRREFEAFRCMTPDADRLLEAYDRPEGFAAFIEQFGGLLLAAVRRRGRTPDPELPANAARFKILSERTAGMPVLMTILDDAGARAGRFPAAGPADVPISVMARRFDVSRTQVRKILRAAVSDGLLKEGGAEGQLEVTASLVDAVEHIHAVAFAAYAGAGYAGLRPLLEPSD